MAVLKVTKKNGDVVSISTELDVNKVTGLLVRKIQLVEDKEIKMILIDTGTRTLIFDLKDVSDIEIF